MQNGCLDFATATLRKTLICRRFPSTQFVSEIASAVGLVEAEVGMAVGGAGEE